MAAVELAGAARTLGGVTPEEESAHGDRITMTAVLADKMGELKATTTEGFAGLHRTLADINLTLIKHGERLTRLETQRETAENMDRRWEDRNEGRREGDQAAAGLRLSKWQVIVGFCAVVVALFAIIVQAAASVLA